MINTSSLSPQHITSTAAYAPTASALRNAGILSSLQDKNTPLESIILLLYSLHENSQAIQHATTRAHMQTLQTQLEARQQQTLVLLEKSINKQLNLQAHYATAGLGKIIQKGLLAAMAGMALTSTTPGFMTAVAASVALFNAADAAIDLISYVQVHAGGTPPEQALAKQVRNIFDYVLNQHNPHPTWASYLVETRTFLLAAVLLNTPMIFAHMDAFSFWLHLGQITLSVAEGIYDIGLGQKQYQLAEISAEQKINQALQDMLKQQLSMLQKGIVKQNTALEDITTATSDALQQQADTTHYINRNII
jgi:DNA-binding transcriptional MerR regulator